MKNGTPLNDGVFICSLLDPNKDGYLNLKCSRFAIVIQDPRRRQEALVPNNSPERRKLVRTEWVYNDRPTTTKN